MGGAEGFRFRVRVSDEILGTFVPIGVYWVYSGLYCLLNDLDRYRLHSKKEEETKNAISKGTVVRGVLFQQSIQAAVSILLFAVSNLVNFFFPYKNLRIWSKVSVFGYKLLYLWSFCCWLN